MPIDLDDCQQRLLTPWRALAKDFKDWLGLQVVGESRNEHSARPARAFEAPEQRSLVEQPSFGVSFLGEVGPEPGELEFVPQARVTPTIEPESGEPANFPGRRDEAAPSRANAAMSLSSRSILERDPSPPAPNANITYPGNAMSEHSDQAGPLNLLSSPFCPQSKHQEANLPGWETYSHRTSLDTETGAQGAAPSGSPSKYSTDGSQQLPPETRRKGALPVAFGSPPVEPRLVPLGDVSHNRPGVQLSGRGWITEYEPTQSPSPQIPDLESAIVDLMLRSLRRHGIEL